MNEVLGHARIEQHFAEAMAEKRLHHAWLLHGVKGIGKRMLADRLTALLMCETTSACGNCHACQMLSAGSHPDVHYAERVEGKRDISIEQVRGVLDFLSLSGAESERRVVILDDAERLNTQAANALLKGLEEPGAGSLLMMVCADTSALPATIRSRCLLQDCSPLSDETVAKVLAGMDIDGEHMELAVSLAEGAPGRVVCMQENAIATAMQQWKQLIRDIPQADIGELEAWIRQHVSRVPHDLIVRLLCMEVYPRLTDAEPETDFEVREGMHHALLGCVRWPGEVIRHGLRPAPSLLSGVLQLRTAMRKA